MKRFNLFFSILILLITVIACESDDNFIEISNDDDSIEGSNDDNIEPEPFLNGILVSNEGPFNEGIGTISFIEEDLSVVTNNIYQDVNDGQTLGNIVQSIGFDNQERAYIISNNSNRIDVVNRSSFEQIARIEEGLALPRFFIEVNGFGYISNWGDPINPNDDFIAIMDLEDFSIVQNIPVAEGPERLLFTGTSIFVTQRGGFSNNNLVTIINPANNNVVTKLKLEIDPTG